MVNCWVADFDQRDSLEENVQEERWEALCMMEINTSDD